MLPNAALEGELATLQIRLNSGVKSLAEETAAKLGFPVPVFRIRNCPDNAAPRSARTTAGSLIMLFLRSADQTNWADYPHLAGYCPVPGLRSSLCTKRSGLSK